MLGESLTANIHAIHSFHGEEYVSPATVKADPDSLRLGDFNQFNDEADVAFWSGILGMSLYIESVF
jgi:hypothetical protein